jgi:hypothetical protein
MSAVKNATVRLGWVGFASLLAADAAPTPFYYASATPFDKQVTTLIVGVNERIGQAVVSQDRKRVTLRMDSSLLGNTAVNRFNYQKSGLGFVGDTPAAPAAGAAPLTPSIAPAPSAVSPGGDASQALLEKPGMTLIEPLER